MKDRVTNWRMIAKRGNDKEKGEIENEKKSPPAQKMIKKRARRTRWAMPCEKRKKKKLNMHEYATRKPLRPLMTSCESRPATVYEDKAKKK
jgi:hypothetical protein